MVGDTVLLVSYQKVLILHIYHKYKLKLAITEYKLFLYYFKVTVESFAKYFLQE